MPLKKLPPPPPKKAAKKIAAKAAKKVAKKAGKKAAKGAGHHRRRAYEHLHRLQILSSRLDRTYWEQIDTMSRYAEAAYRTDAGRTAADLLRAAEHIAFGALASEDQHAVAGELAEALRDEYEHLLDRAAAAWEQLEEKPARALTAIYKGALSAAKASWRNKSYHRALEFARAADALAHAEPVGLQLPSPDSQAPVLLSGPSNH